MAMVLAAAVFIPRHSNTYLVVAWREEETQQSTEGGGLGKRFRDVDMVSLLFCFSFSILISHDQFFLRGSSGIFSRERGLRRLTQDSLERTKGVFGVSPKRTKGALGWCPRGLHRRGGRTSPRRSQVAWCDAKENQGRVGRHPEGLRAHRVAPGRRIPVVR